MKLGSNDISSVYLGSNAVSKVYLGSTEVWSAVDPDAQAFFDRVTTAGGTLSATEQSAILTLVADLKSYGIWSAMKAIYPMVGASAAACAQNLKSSSFTGTFSSGWTFASTGVTPNGTSAYMDTGLIPNNDLSLNDTHISLYNRTNSSRSSYDLNAGGLLEIVPKWTNDTIYYSVNQAEVSGGSISNPQGLLLASRIISSQQKIYQNGSVFHTSNTSSTSLSSLTLILGALNGTTKNYFTNRETALVSCGDGLTDTQAADFYTAVQAFQTTLSRQV